MSDVNQLDSAAIMRSTTQEECKNCSGMFFNQVFAFRRMPALVVGAPRDQLIPMPVFRCSDCGTPIEDMLPEEEMQENADRITESEQKGKIITMHPND